MCSGSLTAVAPLAAHAMGAGDNRRAGRVAGAGLVLAALLAVPVVAALLVADRLLVALGYEPALAAEIGRFLGAIAWAARASSVLPCCAVFSWQPRTAGR